MMNSYKTDNVLHIAVDNFKEFKALLNDIQEKSCELDKLIQQLRNFDFKFDFKVND